MKFRAIITLLIFFSFSFLATPLFASTTDGTIDPNNQGFNIVRFFDFPDIGTGVTDTRINVGKFTTNSARNIHVTDNGLTGFAWGENTGWIVTNCIDTANGCTATNGNFHVAVAADGLLSGFAWGENTGWINFGPFTNVGISQVMINAGGEFGGSLASAGYVWTQNFGWVVFDCSTATNCLHTDYIPKDHRKSGVSGSYTQCADTIDNDGDGLIDLDDPQCGGGSTSEFFYNPVPIYTTPGTTYPVPPPVIQVQPAPTAPTQPSVSVPPQNPNTSSPTIPSEPGTPETPSTPDITNPSTPTKNNTPIRNTIGLPDARSHVAVWIGEAIEWVQKAFDAMNQGLVDFMTQAALKEWVVRVAITGLVGIVAVITAISIIVPIVGIAEIVVLPQLFLRNLLTVLGIIPEVASWGGIYDSVTHQPLAYSSVDIVNDAGQTVATTITQSDGTFSMAVPDGHYTLRVNSQSPLNEASVPLVESVSYTTQGITIQNNIPEAPFDVAVSAAKTPRVINGIREFMLFHEVALTNIAFVLFGAGFFASVLYLVFYPTLTALLLSCGYVVLMIGRALGVVGSYGSVIMSKSTELPLAGKVVTVFDLHTNQPITKTLTSEYGRVYLQVPEGSFYATVHDPLSNNSTSLIKPFSARSGLYRKRFLL